MAETTLDISTKKAIDELKALQTEIIKTGNVAGETKKDLDNAFSDASQGVAGLTKEMQNLSKAQREASTNAETQGKAVSGFGAKVKQSILDIRIFGKSIGEWKEQLSGAASGFISAARSSGLLSGAMKILRAAFISTGIGALIVLIGSAIAYFTRFQSGIDKVSKVMAAAGAVIDVLLDRLVKLGAAIFNASTAFFKLITLDFDGAAQDWSEATDLASQSVSGLGESLSRAAKDAYELEAAMQALRDVMQKNAVLNAQQERDIAKISAALNNQSLTIGQQIGLTEKLGKTKREIAERDLAAAEELLKLTQRAADAEGQGEDAAKQQAARDAQVNFFEKQAALIAVIGETENEVSSLRKKAFEERQANLKKEADLLAKVAETIEKLRVESQEEGVDKELAAVNKRFDDLIQSAEKATEQLEELKKRRALTPEEIAQQEELARLSIALEERRMSTLIQVLSDANEEREALNQEQLDAQKELSEKEQVQLIESINARKEIAELQVKQSEELFKFFIEKARQNGASEEEIAEATAKFELATQEVRLKNEIEFQKAILQATAAGDTERRANIEEQIKLLEAQLSNVRLKISAPEEKKPFDLLEFLGVDADSRDEFEKAVSQIVDGINKITQARVDAARAAVEAANEQVRAAEDAVDAAEEKLDREIEIAETGEANNLALREQELAAAEQQAAAAKKIREDAIKEQQKAAKAQLIVDSATQVSSIVTATANIFKSFSAFPVVGLALAAAQIASMIALFASIRARAKAIAAQKLKRGGEVEGRDRVTGQPDSDGEILVRATPGEFVTNKKQSQKHRPLLEAINAGNVPKMALYLEAIKTGGRRDVAATAGLAGGVSVSVNATDPKLRDLMAKNNALQKRIFELEKNKAQVFDMGDHFLKIKGGRRERIKKQQRW